MHKEWAMRLNVLALIRVQSLLRRVPRSGSLRLTHLAKWKMASQFVDPMNFGWIFHAFFGFL